MRGASVVTVARKHAFAPRYRPEERLSVVTDDGVHLAGGRLTGPADAVATVVLAHGFAHSSRTPRIHAFAHLLARRLHVVVPDLRGHGSSGGVCTLGMEEPLDVAAAVAAAPPGLPVVTLGISLGGAAVLLHAGTFAHTHREIAGVVAISPPAWSGTWDTPGTKRVARYANSPIGRQVLARLLHTRIADHCGAVPDARDLVAGIAPAFTLIVADPADHYFAEEHSLALYEWAREPKDLWLLPGTGHGSDLLSPALAHRLIREIEERLSPGGGPAG
ncbi:MAG TPA: alpha/beta fold hydrolase [Acidimicrobiales bacterium]|nr:alpha/beta fold hydrolase [Acidimicrobiales bacterium]